ncbi:MAG: hypothetical protein HQM09_14590 [Candidatus Riflebacteria bacterium]|nr:hypothetical protein [Candidatus Riflebacteria bacterium]
MVHLDDIPLIRRFGSRTLRRIRLCRGCVIAGLGLSGGFVLGAIASPTYQAGLAATVFAALVSTLSLVPREQRKSKLESRLLPAAALSFAITGGLLGRSLGSLLSVVAAVAVLVLFRFLYSRRGPDRRACTSCAEHNHKRACRGFTDIVARERAFERYALRIMDAARGARP